MASLYLPGPKWIRSATLTASVLFNFTSTTLAALAEIKAVPTLQPRLAILGDSYASGIGAGKFFSRAPADLFCNRFTGAYGFQLALPDSLSATYKFNACAGAKMLDMDAQLQDLKYPYDYATLSIVGNDFGFASLVNNCIYQFTHVLLNENALCRKTLDNTMKDVRDKKKWSDFNGVLNKVLTQVHRNGKIYVNGYAKFWGQPAVGDRCDEMSWSPHLHEGIILSAAHRQKMNDLVDLVNERIQEQVDEVNRLHTTDVLEYIDIDREFEGHRFCDHGQTRGSDDPDTWLIDYLTSFTDKQSAQIKIVADEPSDIAYQGPLADEWSNILNTSNKARNNNDTRDLPNPLLQLMRVFHPKWQALSVIKDKIFAKTGMNARPPRPYDGWPPSNVDLPANISIGSIQYQTREVLHILRQSICGGCTAPVSLPAELVRIKTTAINEQDPFVRDHESCELAMLVEGIDVFVSRGPVTPSCGAVLSYIADTLVRDGESAFEWNGPIQYEHYAAGFRRRQL